MEEPMGEILISIIMGTHNPRPAHLAAAVESIRAQSCSAWELLLFDDGSAPALHRELRKLTAEDPRIRLVPGWCPGKARGLGFALNTCLRYARGRYIARMDDDDWAFPRRLEMQAQYLETHPSCGWVGTQAELFDASGVWGLARRPLYPGPEDFLHSSPFIHPSVMFRREVLEECGGYAEGTLTARCEDLELFMRLYAAGHRGDNLPEVLLRYREDAASLHRSLRYSFYETVIRLRGYRRLQMLSWRTLPFAGKPLCVGLAAQIPGFPRILQRMRTNRKNQKGSCGDYAIAAKH